MDTTLLSVRNLSKTYEVVKALENVSFSIKRGEVHALCGENGAGKSTFIKILTGSHEPSSGIIEYDGKLYKSFTPRQAMDLGINAVYQEFSSVPYLSVTENIFLGCEIKKYGINNISEMNKMAQQLCVEMGVDIDVTKRVCDLGIAYQQIVEILKAISKKPKFIIMDEPTAPLTLNETSLLFNVIIKKLKANGTTILFISHRLEEVFEIRDRVTVFCDGQYITTKDIDKLTKKELISYMVGRELKDDFPHANTSIGEKLLEVKHVSNKKLHDISFYLRKGEILGFGGLIGAGRTEVARAIFGADRIEQGEMFFKGKRYKPRNPKDSISHGIGLIPEDRKTQGIIPMQSVKENITLSALKNISYCMIIDQKDEVNKAKEYVSSLKIKTPSLSQYVKNLSGGNQQKTILAKIMASNCDVLIFDEPTRGIDVGAKQEIYALMCELVSQGKSIIMISSEMPELIGMSNRILVMCNGSITGEILKKDFSQEKILEMASGS